MPWPQALERAAQMRFVQTGLQPLDLLLKGGLRVGTLTELVGAAGTGKTQLAMQTICFVGAYRQGAVYVDTEQKLSLERLQEICAQRANQEFFAQPATVLQNLTVHKPASMDELKSVLGQLEEEIVVRNQQHEYPVRLLILDSIAAPARRDFTADSAPQRAAAVMHCAQTLKRLALEFSLAVLIINQVGGSWNHNQSGEVPTNNSSSRDTRAALGTAWHHCVTTRIQLTQHQGGEPAGRVTAPVRTASVVKSNAVGQGESIGFVINNTGLVASPL